MTKTRDHGGGLDAAITRYGGPRTDWLDLSTGINPVPYPVGGISSEAWSDLPDTTAQDRLISAARSFWDVPEGLDIIAAPGASALIARLPALGSHIGTHIPGPTYNEHEAAFRSAGIDTSAHDLATHIYVHPNNPDGVDRRTEIAAASGLLTIIDESFCDTAPELSTLPMLGNKRALILKSFGKFWGLAGLRLGFAIAPPKVFAPTERLRLASGMHQHNQFPTLQDLMGPWAVSGPALEVGARALTDTGWADATRKRLAHDSQRLDAMMTAAGVELVGGTSLFRLYDVGDAAAWQDKLARAHIWSRIFPYSDKWLRLGLPAPDRWDQLEAAL